MSTPAPAARRSRTWWTPVVLLLVATAAALALRVSIGRGIGYPTDMVHFVEWADKGAQHPLGMAYARTGSNHPPIAVTTLWLLGTARRPWPVLVRADNRFLSIKAPAIAADLLVAWLIYLIAARVVGRGAAAVAAAFYLFNPAVISDSTLWGQTDGLVPVFPLLALYALQRGSWWLVGPLLAAGLAVKFQSVPLIATILAFTAVDAGVVRAALTVGAGGVAFAAITLPFTLHGQFRAMMSAAYFGNVDVFPSLRFGALNLWDLADPPIPDDDWVIASVLGVPVTPKLLGLALFALAWLPPTLAGCARRDVLGRAFTLGLVAWAFFMFPTQIHERYLLPAVAFTTLAAAGGRPIAVVTAFAVSVIHLYSCYFRYSSGTEGLLDLMRLLPLPLFFAALYALRDEPFDMPSGSRWLATLARRATERVGLAIVALAVASALAGAAVNGWFSAWSSEVPLASLAPYRPARAPAPDAPAGAVRVRAGESIRFRFPPVFARLRTDVAVGDAGPCAATFTLRSPAGPIWDSGPVATGAPSGPVDVELPSGLTEIVLSAQPATCTPAATFDWIAPRLVPRPTADALDATGTLHVSDMRIGPRWPLSLVDGSGEWRRDRSLRGAAIAVGGRTFAKGISVRANSVLHVRVPDGATALVTDVGYADEATTHGASGKLTFVILADGREAHRSADLPPRRLVGGVRVPVAGARTVTLIVESAVPAPGDQGAWAGARFVADAGG